MVIIPDEVKDHKRCSTRTINQHDFDRGYVAMKDPVKRSCWVKPLGERGHMKKRKKSWTVEYRSLDKDRVEREVGSILADFCSDSYVFMLRQEFAVKPAWNAYVSRVL
ncbi:uncharacterized protein LOC121385949 [Gigantopelta aegis]|uniref:uncharacterized protein LOC121385949 n=1 Tax=Gigantopelta aegis TaxID=1735272 RepID=UPI001B88CE4B|nr:uncharacterized protein LOC121385949 [Gigantopelta aegis]